MKTPTEKKIFALPRYLGKTVLAVVRGGVVQKDGRELLSSYHFMAFPEAFLSN